MFIRKSFLDAAAVDARPSTPAFAREVQTIRQSTKRRSEPDVGKVDSGIPFENRKAWCERETSQTAADGRFNTKVTTRNLARIRLVGPPALKYLGPPQT